eukprot:1805857-Amphidinium_carterae.2
MGNGEGSPIGQLDEYLSSLSWPPVDPDEPEPDKTHAKILAALVMDDYEHRSDIDYLSPGFPIFKHVVPEQRIRRADHWLDLPDNQVDIALDYAQETIDEEYAYVMGAREEARVDHNYYAENAQRGVVA